MEVAQLLERIATLTSILRSREQEAVRAAAHGSQGEREERVRKQVAQLRKTVAQLERAVG